MPATECCTCFEPFPCTTTYMHEPKVWVGVSDEDYCKTPHCRRCDRLLPGTVIEDTNITRPDGWF